MNLHITTILVIILEHINRIFTQGIPISPCPKMFQYRFDGQEWFGILSVRNPDFGQALHLRVTLSMRGKPTTNYLGEIELLTRGQFLSDGPVLYRVKFPKTHFPPKLLQITTNNHIVCLGAADHSIFVTQIQLEHTRKFTFIPDDLPLPLNPGFGSAPPSQSSGAAHGGGGGGGGAIMGGPGVKDPNLLPTNMGFGTKHLPLAGMDKHPMRTTKDICGRIDDRIRFQVLHAMKAGRPGSAEDGDDDNQGSADELLPRVGAVPNVPLVTADEDGGTTRPSASSSQSGSSADGSTALVEELPSITRGAWPWLAAIYVNNLTSLAYQCGGTLVSSRIVISSAHCFQMFRKRYTANEVLVFLGRHNLKNWNEEGSLAAPCDDIFIHPDYDSHLNTYDADIAVVVLKHEVRFNTFIRPACMWSGSTKSEYIEGEHGIVVGWGLGGSGGNGSAAAASALATAVPRIVDAPIVSNDVCFQANDKFRSLSSNRTFCAGFVVPAIVTTTTTTKTPDSPPKIITPTKTTSTKFSDGGRRRLQSGPCSGDSGAGLMIFKNNRWMLRGTVSASLPIAAAESAGDPTGTGKASCNVNQYVIYTDVGKFLDWIFAFII